MRPKCETCANSRMTVSETGSKRVCSLLGGLDFLCEIGKVDRHTTPPGSKKTDTEEGGQK